MNFQVHVNVRGLKLHSAWIADMAKSFMLQKWNAYYSYYSAQQPIPSQFMVGIPSCWK
jgi:hypothetical protein